MIFTIYGQPGRRLQCMMIVIHGLGIFPERSAAMKKNFTVWLMLSAAIMLFLPWSAVTFVKGDAGMAACFLLFYAVNPVYSILLGIASGKEIRQMWCQPILSSALYFMGTWIFFDMGETAFLLYAGIYLLLGMAAMLISGMACRKTGRSKGGFR